MRTVIVAFAVALCAPNTPPAAVAEPKPDADGFVSLFDGKDLAGWDGDARFWSVTGGAIRGRTTAENASSANTFLIWKGGEVADFELRLRARITGNNSGIQYRSRVNDSKTWKVVGYQADFGPGPNHYAKLSDEGGPRSPIARTGEKVFVGPDGKSEVVGSVGLDAASIRKGMSEGEWYDVTVVARGDRLVHKINGQVTIDCVDRHPGSLKVGVIALQIHGGAPMTVEFKDIRLKRFE